GVGGVGGVALHVERALRTCPRGAATKAPTATASGRSPDFFLVLVGRSGRGHRPAHVGGPGDDLEAAIGVFRDRHAAFYPVAAVDVEGAVLHSERGVVD